MTSLAIEFFFLKAVQVLVISHMYSKWFSYYRAWLSEELRFSTLSAHSVGPNRHALSPIHPITFSNGFQEIHIFCHIACCM